MLGGLREIHLARDNYQYLEQSPETSLVRFTNGTTSRTKKIHTVHGPHCDFTDDSVLTIALADAVLNGQDYGEIMKECHGRYPRAGYGATFNKWALFKEIEPY